MALDGGRTSPMMSSKLLITKETRRRFLLDSFQLTTWYALFQMGTVRAAWAGDMARIMRSWAQRLAYLADDVRTGRIAPEGWQRAIEHLHNTVPLEALIK